jgi:8-oxo-dGTP diphosphatase
MGNFGHPVTIVVDVANVMGSRPDGWWRNRAGAAVRLHGQIARLAATGRVSLPGPPGPDREAAWPRFVMVLEGAARAAADRLAAPGPNGTQPGGTQPGGTQPSETEPGETGAVAPGEVRVVRARGSGDDAIVALVRELPGRRVVVTADRELRHRAVAVGAEIAGPSWLLDHLSSSR